MADQPRTDELAQLRAALAAQQGQIAALRARADRPRRRFPRRFLPLAIVVLLAALMPLSILAAGPVFSDLGTAAPVHQPNIQAIGDAGITTGFEDPNNPGQRLYNPKDNVTREEMASFLARTAGLGGNAPVVNAAQLGGVPAASYVQNGASPTFADLAVTGTLTHEYVPGQPRSLAPLAYGTIKFDGAVNMGTGNFTSIYNAVAKLYEITFPGVTYEMGPYLTVATPLDTNRQIRSTSGVGGKLLIGITDNSGNPVQGQFQFITYQAGQP